MSCVIARLLLGDVTSFLDLSSQLGGSSVVVTDGNDGQDESETHVVIVGLGSQIFCKQMET